MNIFYKRPLCLILCIMLGGFLFFSLSSPPIKVTLIALAILLIALSAVLYFLKRKIMYSVLSLSLFLGIALSQLYFGVLFFADSAYEGAGTFTGTVEATEEGDYSFSVTLRIEEVSGETTDFRAYAIIGYDEADTVFWQGDKVTLVGVLKRAGDSYLLGRGISNEITDISKAELIHKREAPPLSERLGYMRETLSLKLINYTNPETGGLLAALITGERSYLSEGMRLDFRRAGLLHILALSGMHLAIIVLAVSKLLRLLRIPYKPRLLLALAFGVAYTYFVGCPITALRALIMLAVATVLRLFARSPDAPTGIAVALAAIVIATPYAIYDTALWLSVLATAGVIGAGGLLRAEKREGSKSGIWARLRSALLPTIFALSLISVLSVTLFGSISLVSPIATLAVSLPIEILIYLALIMLCIGNVIPISALIKPVGSLVSYIVGAFSEIEWVLVRTDGPIFMIFSVLLFLSATLFFVLKIRRKRLFLGAHVALFIMFFAVSGIISVSELNRDTVSVSAADGNDFILASKDGETIFLSAARYSTGTGIAASDFLAIAGKLHIDKYCVGYYSMNIYRELSVVLSQIKTDEVLLPLPRNDDERYIARRVKDLVLAHGAALSYFGEDAPIRIQGAAIHLLHSREYGTGASRSAFALKYGDKTALYLSAGTLTHEDTKDLIKIAKTSEALIFGSAGEAYSKEITFDEEIPSLRTLIISSKRLTIKEELKEYYKNNGCELISHPYHEEIFD